MNVPWWLNLYVLMMISLINTGYNKLPNWLLCPVTPTAGFLSEAPPCFASACLCFIGILIVPSVFFKEVTGWHLTLSSCWDFTACREAARSPGVLPNLAECKAFLLITQRVIQSHNYKIQTCWHALAGKFEGTNTWPSNGDRWLKTIFPGAPCDYCANTVTFSPPGLWKSRAATGFV